MDKTVILAIGAAVIILGAKLVHKIGLPNTKHTEKNHQTAIASVTSDGVKNVEHEDFRNFSLEYVYLYLREMEVQHSPVDLNKEVQN